MNYARDVIQVNHVLNNDVAKGTHGFWAGAHAGLLSMQENMKKPIGILSIDSCQFYYDIATIHKKASLSAAVRRFLAALGEQADGHGLKP